VKIARFLVTPEFLCDLLHLPIGTEILCAGMVPEAHWPAIVLTVRSPTLRDVDLAQGERPPLVTPRFERLIVKLEDGDLPFIIDRRPSMIVMEWGQT